MIVSCILSKFLGQFFRAIALLFIPDSKEGAT